MVKILIFGLILLSGCDRLASLKVHKSEGVHGAQPKYDLQRSPEYKVLTVSDGDTVAIEMDNKRVNVRFACIDAPETNHGSKKPGQPLGTQAKQKLKELINKSNNTIRLNITVEKDNYGRKVAEVILDDNATAQEHLALAGLAWPYDRYKANCPSWNVVKAAGEAAKNDSLGVYGSSANIPPWEWRRAKWK